jgi:RNA polymerase sigma-70 factor (ECF subfamily)
MLNSTLPVSLFRSPPVSNRPRLGLHRSQNDAVAAEAVRRAQSGDHEAFAQLYGLHKKRVFSICLRMVANFALAEDLTQEVFLQLHRKIASFRGDAAFTTWLHRLATNVVLMHLRKRGLTQVSLDQLTEHVPEERASRAFGKPDLHLVGAVDRVAIQRAVATLAPGYRTVFLLHDMEGLDHGEIAGHLGCSRGNTKSQLHKARRALRKVLAVDV